MTTRKTELKPPESGSRRWLWPALFVALFLIVFAGGYLITSQGFLGPQVGQTSQPVSQSAASTAPQTPDPAQTAVVATVNDQTITQSDINQAIAVGRVFFRAANGQPPERVDQAGVVRQLVDDALIRQAADEAGISASDQEVAAFIQQLKASQGISDQALAAAMQAEAVSMDVLQSEIRRVVINNKFVQQQVAAGVPADQIEIARANWLEAQRAQANINMQQDDAAQPIAGEGDALIGAQAPEFTLTDLEGNEVALSDLAGKAVLINFWASWCAPCREEMPAIEAMYQKYKDQGFQVLAVDVREEPAPVRSFVEDFGLSFPILLDQSGEVAGRYGVGSLPGSYFVNPQGAITAVQVGAMTPQEIETYTTEAIASTQTPEQQTADDDEDPADADVH